MAKMTEVDLLGEAIEGTEKEIFSESLGNAMAEEDGDRSLEEMTEPADEEGEDVEAQADQDDEVGDEDGEPEERPRAENGQFISKDEAEQQARQAPQPEQRQQPQRQAQRVPVSELVEERRARQAAEARVAQLTSESNSIQQRFAALEQRLDAALQRQNPQPQQPAAQEPEVDIFADPNRVLADRDARLMQQFEQRLANQRVETSFALAHEQLGDKFEQAYKDLTSLPPSDPVARTTVQQIMSAPNPAKALMQWHTNQSIAKEVGGDPNAYRERIKQELMQDQSFRQQVISELRGQARGNGRTDVRPAQRRSVPSLNEASGGSSPTLNRDPDLYDDSDRSAFDFAFKA